MMIKAKIKTLVLLQWCNLQSKLKMTRDYTLYQAHA